MIVSQMRRRFILTVFMISTFAIGMTEYVVTGLMTQFASDLNVNLATTGLLLSIYAVSVAIFGPIVRIVTIKIQPRSLLIGLMIVFIVSNFIAATAPNFEILLLSRLLSAVMHAPFFGLCMSIAYNLSTSDKGPSAIAMVQGGLTIAIMLGVPFGSYLGGTFEWRYVFWLIVVIGIVSLIGLFLVTPKQKNEVPPNIREEIRVFKNPNVLLILAIVVFGFSGVFTAYTFLEPMLRELSGFGVNEITIGLFLFGLGAVLGNFISGKTPPPLLTKRLILSLVILAIVLLLFTWLLPFKGIAFLMCLLFGAGTFGTTPILNSKIIITGWEAPSLSGTISASVFNVANCFGATLSTLFLNTGASFKLITSIAGVMVLFGMFLTVLTYKIENNKILNQQSG
ncbi:MFS transporter [Priestia megaterium]|uniref:MFS transporter n=1 Tax=Priestia megaterium TaxID=1404 RepID=UPI0020403C91|nr:MFS transporter [Priestia megaterium]MCM3186742.1 MFS transporter [Priestia megaterium]